MPRYILETPAPLTSDDIAQIVRDIPGDSEGVATLKPEARTLHIIGRRWFRKSHGGTYHTAEIIIDGKTVHKTEKAYGYGSQFLVSACDWLKSAGHLPDNAEGDTLYLREKSGFAFTYEAHDVPREKDL